MSEIKDKYKKIISETTDLSKLQGIEQAILGYRTAPFVEEYIPVYDRKPLFEEYNLFLDIIAQKKAINICKMDNVKNSNQVYLDENVFKVDIAKVQEEREKISPEEILESTNKYLTIVKPNDNPDLSKLEQFLERINQKDRELLEFERRNKPKTFFSKRIK